MAFIHCFVERVERLRMFIHSDRVELLYCLISNYREPGNMYLLEMAINLLLCGFRLFMFCWTSYHTDLEQMLKNAKIFVKMDTEYCKLLVKEVFNLKDIIILIQKL